MRPIFRRTDISNQYRHRIRFNRRGLSVIEVLTSILVATIGVAGVMVVIPFAVGQAEQGLDQESASTFGLAAADDFIVKGYAEELTSIDLKIATDPIGSNAGITTFPYVMNPLGPATSNIFAPLRTTYSKAFPILKNDFSWMQDIVHGAPDPTLTAAVYPTADLAPPNLFFDIDSGNAVRRQSEGELTSRVLSFQTLLDCCPSLNGEPNFRHFFLVDRRRALPIAGSVKQPYDRVYDVDHPGKRQGLNTLQFRMSNDGGEFILRSSTFHDSNEASTQHSAIRRGDWICLCASDFGANSIHQHTNFFQVIDSELIETTPPAWQVTLRGADHDFLIAYDEDGDPIADNYDARFPYCYIDNDDNRYPSKTFAIHLPDVWAVIERTSRGSK
jgi:hypothetical protein